MTALTRFVLDHRRVVLGFWVIVTIAAFAAIGPASDSLSQQFSAPGLEASETNQKLAEIYGSGGDIAPIVPVVKLAQGKTVDSPGITRQLDAAVGKVEAALPEARTASYAPPATGRSSPMTVAPPSRSCTSRRRAASIRAGSRRRPRRRRCEASRSAVRPLR